MYYISIGQHCSNLQHGTVPGSSRTSTGYCVQLSTMFFSWLPSLGWRRHIYLVVHPQYSTPTSVISPTSRLLKNISISALCLSSPFSSLPTLSTGIHLSWTAVQWSSLCISLCASLDISLRWISERRHTGSDYMNFFMALDIHIDKFTPKKSTSLCSQSAIQ